MNIESDALRQDDNPYSSPLAIEPARRMELPIAIWARGELVVAHRSASWPAVCVVSGATGEKAIYYAIATHYPVWISVAFLGSVVICMVLSVILIPSAYSGLGVLGAIGVNLVGLFATIAYMAKPTQITYYLSSHVFALRKHKLRLALALNLFGGAVIVLSIASRFYVAPSPVAMAGVFIGIVIAAAGGRYRAPWHRILKPVKMHREYTVLRGAGKPFLATLPEWPFGAV